MRQSLRTAIAVLALLWCAGLVPTLIGLMDIVVHLSRREGLPRALPQALAAARPVLAYDCDGASEVCRDGETGFLIPLGDTRTLKEQLLKLAADASLRESLGRRGQSFVREYFSVERMVDDLHALYLRLDNAKIIESEAVAPGVIVDFDSKNRVVGLEVLNVSKRVSKPKRSSTRSGAATLVREKPAKKYGA